MILSRNSGCHTGAFSKAKQGYHALQALADDAYERGYEVRCKHDKYNLNHTYKLDSLSEQGVKFSIHQYATHPGFARLKLTFGSLLSDEYDPLRLYKGKKDEWDNVQDAYSDLFELDGFPSNLNKLSLSRLDLTEDIELTSASEVDWMVHVLGKSMKSTKYHRERFTHKRKDVVDPDEANHHSMEYCTQATRRDKKRQCITGIQPRTAFKAYNKTYEINQRSEQSKRIKNKILRLELTHSGVALRRKLKLNKKSSNKKIINSAAQQAHELIWRFMKSGMFTEGRFYRYDDAIQIIEQSFDISKDTRVLMQRLCHKVSECDNLGNALNRMGLGKKEQRRLLRLFAKLNLSPVTLPNEKTPKQLPSIAEFMKEDVAD